MKNLIFLMILSFFSINIKSESCDPNDSPAKQIAKCGEYHFCDPDTATCQPIF